MFKKSLTPIIARKGDNIYQAYWNYSRNKVPTMVLDENDYFVGIIDSAAWERALLSDDESITLDQIINYNCTTISPLFYKDVWLYG